MKNLFHGLRLLLAAGLVLACSPAKTWVSGNTLTTNTRPACTITGQQPLVVCSHGRLYPQATATASLEKISLSFDYAYFMPLGKPSALAYAAIVKIDNYAQWNFNPPTTFAGTFSETIVNLGGYEWSVQLMRISSVKDWGSKLYEQNGGNTPEFWLAKRWIAHCDNSVRAVMEYREPWPETLNFLQPATLLASDAGNKALENFLKAADAAFTVTNMPGDPSKLVAEPPHNLTSTLPDIAKLVGEIVSIQGK